jgi:hypothetical protein
MKIFFNNNPWHKPALPKSIQVRRKDAINFSDTQELKKILRIKRPELAFIVSLLEKYGWRVGIFEKMEVDSAGNWTSFLKTSRFKGKLTKQEMNLPAASG